jgi:hypothetical protein
MAKVERNDDSWRKTALLYTLATGGSPALIQLQTKRPAVKPG